MFSIIKIVGCNNIIYLLYITTGSIFIILQINKFLITVTSVCCIYWTFLAADQVSVGHRSRFGVWTRVSGLQCHSYYYCFDFEQLFLVANERFRLSCLKSWVDLCRRNYAFVTDCVRHVKRISDRFLFVWLFDSQMRLLSVPSGRCDDILPTGIQFHN